MLFITLLRIRVGYILKQRVTAVDVLRGMALI